MASRRRSAMVCGIVQPHRDRVAGERAFMQDLDVRALDEAELEQAVLDPRSWAGRRSPGSP